MLKMFREICFKPLSNQSGVGLITAIFVVVVVGMFGVLIARFATVSATASAEDYFWGQSLYSAQSVAQNELLYGDGGGSGSNNMAQVSGFTVTATSIVSGVRAQAERNFNGRPIKRTIEIHFN